MQSKFLSRRILLTIALTGLTLSLVLIFYFIQQVFSPPMDGQVQSSTMQVIENTAFLPKQEPARTGLPVKIKIPKINVDATMVNVGITSEGAMDVPKGPDDVAWFEPGPRPGEEGSSVVAGHRGWENGQSAVFDNLYKLRKGDKIYIEDDKGMVISFVVRESRRYDPDADASDVFGSNDGKAHLNLITCEGVWDKISKSYSKRLVVFTDKEEGDNV